nr:MAG TPA: putative tail component [Caudoviricetes sp.]
MSIEITLNANFDDYAGDNLDDAVAAALERVGSAAEGFAADLTPPPVTGRLRNSMTHIVRVDDRAVDVGSDVKYAKYVELGTGRYASGGRNTPWVYKDDKGNWHYTHGQRAQPFLKPALQNNIKTYQAIIKDELGGK